MLLLHGFLGAPQAWQAVLDALPSHGPVVCPWLPGHGPAPTAGSDWAGALAWCLSRVPPGAVLAGYSMGARLALAAALHLGPALRAALLVGGHVGLSSPAERGQRAAQDAQRARALRTGPMADFVRDWEALPLFASQGDLPPQVQAQQRQWRLAHTAEGLAWSFEVAGLACMPDLRPAVAQAARPLCWLTGSRDERFDALAASLVRPPWVRHARVAGAGHNLLLEAPAAVARALAGCMASSPDGPCAG